MEDSVKPTYEEKLKYWESSFIDVLPAGYSTKTLDQLEASDEKSILTNYDEGEDDFGFLLMGQSGVGKTFALAGLMNKVLKACHTHDAAFSQYVAYYPISYLIYKLRSQREPHEYNTCIRVKFLFLDDLGAENTTDFAREHFFSILDLRCQKKMPTFITTNLGFNELKEKYGDRIVSSLKEMCIPLALKGTDKLADIMKQHMADLKSRLNKPKMTVIEGEKGI